MLRLSVLAAILLLFIGTLSAQEAGNTDSIRARQQEGRALAAEVMNAVGGERAWNDRSWNLEFDFVLIRDGKEGARFSHGWNRTTNAYGVTGKTRDGKQWHVRFTDVIARQGSATLDGSPASDSLLSELLALGYGRFINDGYWLLMPFKLLDPGVNHWRQPDTVIDGSRYQVLRLSFGKVGLTPGDRYWLYIDPRTKLVQRWNFILEGGGKGDFYWQDYTDYGGIKLPLRRRSADGTMEIRFENIRVGRFEPRIDMPGNK